MKTKIFRENKIPIIFSDTNNKIHRLVSKRYYKRREWKRKRIKAPHVWQRRVKDFKTLYIDSSKRSSRQNLKNNRNSLISCGSSHRNYTCSLKKEREKPQTKMKSNRDCSLEERQKEFEKGGKVGHFVIRERGNIKRKELMGSPI